MPEHVKIGLIANLCMLFVFAGCMVYTTASKEESPPEPVYTECEVVAEEPDTTDISVQTMALVIDEPTYPISQEEIDLIALVTMAEAEGECEEGKRLVIDTILNRVDHERFPDTVAEVIYQKNQFSSMWNGRVDRCYVMDNIVQLVKEELLIPTTSPMRKPCRIGYSGFTECHARSDATFPEATTSARSPFCFRFAAEALV